MLLATVRLGALSFKPLDMSQSELELPVPGCPSRSGFPEPQCSAISCSRGCRVSTVPATPIGPLCSVANGHLQGTRSRLAQRAQATRRTLLFGSGRLNSPAHSTPGRVPATGSSIDRGVLG